MIKVVIAGAIVLLVGMVAAIQEAYEAGYQRGYCEGVVNAEKIIKKEGETKDAGSSSL